MAIHPFERLVWPRKLGSPFLKGIKGPGGIGESVEKAEGEKIYGGGTGRKKPRRAPAPPTPATPGPAKTSHSSFSHPATAQPPLQPPPLQQAAPQRRIHDRTVITAAGGLSALGSSPLLESLPPKTGMLAITLPFTLHLRQMILG